VGESSLLTVVFAKLRQVVHRDVKPGNIVTALDGSLNVKLIDFGMACKASSTEPTGAAKQHVYGTLDYCSQRAHLGPGRLRSLSLALVLMPSEGLSFRDDLESLSYTILRLVRGNLPWKVTRRQLGYDKTIHLAVQDLKAQLATAWLFEGLPFEMADLRALACELRPGQKPDLTGPLHNLTSLAASLPRENLPWQPIDPFPYRMCFCRYRQA
jgi:serine/threonine protein kinase